MKVHEYQAKELLARYGVTFSPAYLPYGPSGWQLHTGAKGNPIRLWRTPPEGAVARG